MMLGGAFFLDALWFLVLIGFVPLFFLLDHTIGRARFIVALGFGIVYAEFLGFPFFSFLTINGIPLSGEVRAWAMGAVFLYLLMNGALAGFLLWSAFAFFTPLERRQSPSVVQRSVVGGAMLPSVESHKSVLAEFIRPYFRVCAVVLAWIIFETILAKINNGAQWGMIGESLVPFRVLRIWARTGGALLLSAMVLLINIILSVLFCLRKN